MKTILTASQMKQCDDKTINYYGIPSIVLMERAALLVCDAISDDVSKHHFGKTLLVVCGTGNNGGDGLAVARIMEERGFKVTIVLVGNHDKLSDGCRSQFDIVLRYGMEVLNKIPEKEFDIIVDALFGIGLSRDLEGEFLKTVQTINRMADTRVYCVDIPSGVHSDTGMIMGEAVKADITITFGFYKRGLLLYPGNEYCGLIELKDVGIRLDALLEEHKNELLFCMDESDRKLIPKRSKAGNKGTYGKVLLIAGSTTMGGACEFAGMAAYRMGCGVVKIVTAIENCDMLKKVLPEAVLVPYESLNKSSNVEIVEIKERIEDSILWADVIAIGPGLDTSKNALLLLDIVLNLETNKPLIIDADGLNLLAKYPDRMSCLIEQVQRLNRKVILTPHIGEFSRLSKISIPKLKGNLTFYAKEFSKKTGMIVIAKDARTVTAVADNAIYLNLTGNDGMATAGSGDVLTGMILGLLGQHLEPETAAPLAVYLHGIAGDMAAVNCSNYSMMARDIIESIPQIMKLLSE